MKRSAQVSGKVLGRPRLAAGRAHDLHSTYQIRHAEMSKFHWRRTMKTSTVSETTGRHSCDCESGPTVSRFVQAHIRRIVLLVPCQPVVLAHVTLHVHARGRAVTGECYTVLLSCHLLLACSGAALSIMGA